MNTLLGFLRQPNLHLFFVMLNIFTRYQIQDSTPVKIHPDKWFWGYALIHTILWAIAPIFFRPTIPFDSAEGYAWGNQFQWGYDKHPFIAPWMTSFFSNYFGGVGIGNYIASQLCVLIAFVAIYQLAKKMLSPLQALLAILVMSGLDFYTLASNKIDPDILTLATWALAILAFYHACVKGNTFNWILTGIACGLAMMSKYTTLLLLISMLFFLIYNEHTRGYFKKPALYIGLLSFLIVILPNTLWLIRHDFISVSYALGRGTFGNYQHHPTLNHFLHPLRFLADELLRLLLLFVVAYPLLFCKRIYKQDRDYFKEQFLICLFSGPFIIALVISLLFGVDMHSGWAFPFFTLSGITLIYFLRPQVSLKAFKLLMIFVIVISFGLIVGRYTFMNIGPYFTHKAGKPLYPMKQVATYVKKDWQTHFHKPLQYVAGSRYLTAFMTAYMPNHPTPYYSWSKIHSAWIDEAKLRKAGAMFVWWADGQSTPHLPAAILQRFPRVKDLKLVTFNMLTKQKVEPLTIGVAILPPQTS